MGTFLWEVSAAGVAGGEGEGEVDIMALNR